MFDFDSNLVQVELGENAFAVLSSKDKRSTRDKIKGTPAPGWADDLSRKTTELQKKLKAEGISLPRVLFIKASELPENTFRITFGIASNDFDVHQHDYLFAMEEMAREFHSADMTCEKVREQLSTALSHVLQREYHAAMQLLMKVYYQSALVEDQTSQVVSLLNMAGICLINNQLNGAYIAARQAQLIVEKIGFYDPYLKFYAHKAIANIEVSGNDIEAGIAHFEQAFQDIKPVGETDMIIDALHDEASVYMQVGAYKKCAEILDKIIEHISSQKPDEQDPGLLISLYKMRVLTASRTEEELRRNLNQMRRAYEDLSKSFPRKAANAILTILTNFGPYCISMSIGALLSGVKYYNPTVIQNNVDGNNIIIERMARL